MIKVNLSNFSHNKRKSTFMQRTNLKRGKILSLLDYIIKNISFRRKCFFNIFIYGVSEWNWRPAGRPSVKIALIHRNFIFAIAKNLHSIPSQKEKTLLLGGSVF